MYDEDEEDEDEYEPEFSSEELEPDPAKIAMFRAAAKEIGMPGIVMEPSCCSCTHDPLTDEDRLLKAALGDEPKVPYMFLSLRDGTLNDPTFWQRGGKQDEGYIAWDNIGDFMMVGVIAALENVGFKVEKAPASEYEAITVSL